jgi:hypothetical protein
MSCIEDLVQEIGTLRRSWKITKRDDDRYKEIETEQYPILAVKLR